MGKLPLFKKQDIVVQEAGDELLIYDLTINKAYNLNETSKIVYEACDGVTTFDDLKSKHKYSDEIIYLALDELEKNNLLQETYVSPFAGMNRREVIRKVGLATMVALPVISGLVAPSAAHAASLGVTCASPGGFPCNTSADCAVTAPGCSTPTSCGCFNNCCNLP